LVLKQIPARVVGAFAAVGDTLELAPAITERKSVLDVHSSLRVVRQLLRRMLVAAQVGWTNAELDVPAFALGDPVVEPLFVGAWLDEVLQLHLLEFQRPEHEIPRRDLVSERLSYLCDTKWQPPTHGRRNIGKIDEDSLRGFRR